MLAYKGSRDRCRDKAGLKRALRNQLTNEKAMRGQEASA